MVNDEEGWQSFDDARRHFHEDASCIRRAPGILARLRSFVYNILRFNQSDTIAHDRYAAALGDGCSQQ
jgi:hypothetical protein